MGRHRQLWALCFLEVVYIALPNQYVRVYEGREEKNGGPVLSSGGVNRSSRLWECFLKLSSTDRSPAFSASCLCFPSALAPSSVVLSLSRWIMAPDVSRAHTHSQNLEDPYDPDNLHPHLLRQPVVRDVAQVRARLPLHTT